MEAIEQAFKTIQRQDFLPANLRQKAVLDEPLPIGFGQTISQPTTVRLMLEWLAVERGQKILDVGSGSGWTTALLSHLTGPQGMVLAVERIADLVSMGRANCFKVGIANARFFLAGREYGLPKYSPYDRILVSAAAQVLPNTLVSQLRNGGKLVIPVNNDILEIIKSSKHDYMIKTHHGFVFVPLI